MQENQLQFFRNSSGKTVKTDGAEEKASAEGNTEVASETWTPEESEESAEDSVGHAHESEVELVEGIEELELTDAKQIPDEIEQEEFGKEEEPKKEVKKVKKSAKPPNTIVKKLKKKV